jgi:hypothetical protein
MPVQSVQCTNCSGWNTTTHYFHVAPAPINAPHNFEHPNDPPPAAAGPVDQSCPINGCFTNFRNPPPVGWPYAGHAVFTLCLDCGHIS